MATITRTQSDLRAFFAQSAIPSFNQENWAPFREGYSSTPADLIKPLNQLPVDFSGGHVHIRWQDTALKICRILLMIIIFPWGLYVAVRYLVQRLIMTAVFPFQNSLLKVFLRVYRTEELNKARQEMQPNLNRTQIRKYTTPDGVIAEQSPENPYLVRQIVLEKNGARYRALMIATAESLRTRHWVLQAPGNAVPIEYVASLYAQWYTQEFKASLLIVQGPGSGDNDGEVPSTDLGEPFDLALSCIETDFQAERIVLCGYSLGTASIGQMIKKHPLDTDKRTYIVVRQMGFDSTANVAFQWVGFNNCCTCPCLGHIARGLMHWTDCTLDNVEASRILQERNIVEIIIQSGFEHDGVVFQHDGVIPPKACLGHALKVQGITQNKIFKYLPNAPHTDSRPVLMAMREAFEELDLLPPQAHALIGS